MRRRGDLQLGLVIDAVGAVKIATEASLIDQITLRVCHLAYTFNCRSTNTFEALANKPRWRSGEGPLWSMIDSGHVTYLDKAS